MFEVFSDSGKMQLSADDKVLVVHSERTYVASEWEAAGASSTLPRIIGRMPEGCCLAATKAFNSFHSLRSGSLNFTLKAPSATTVTIVFLKVVSLSDIPASGLGLVVYTATGEVSYYSGGSPAKLVGIVNSPTLDSVATPYQGNNYLVIPSSTAGYWKRVSGSLNGNTEDILDSYEVLYRINQSTGAIERSGYKVGRFFEYAPYDTASRDSPSPENLPTEFLILSI